MEGDTTTTEEEMGGVLPLSIWNLIANNYIGSLEVLAALSATCKSLRNSLFAQGNPKLVAKVLAASLKSPSIALLTLFKTQPQRGELANGYEVAKSLIVDYGADVHFYGDACLRTAVRLQKPIGWVELMVKNGADGSAEYSEALREAVQQGRLDLVMLLVESSSSPAKAADNSSESLIIAIEGDHLDIAKYLLVELPSKHPKLNQVDPNTNAGLPLTLACQKSSYMLAKMLLDRGAKAAINNDAPIKALCKLIDDFDGVSMESRMTIDLYSPRTSSEEARDAPLVERKKPVEAEDILQQFDSNPIDVSLLTLLLDNGASPAASHYLPLSVAGVTGNLSLLQRLLPSPHPNFAASSRSNLCLRLASAMGHLEVVKELIQVHKVNQFFSDGSKVTEQDEDPTAEALILAAERGHTHLVSYLLEEAEADLGAQDDAALRGACGFGRIDTVKYLLEVGADVHADGDDALSRAARGGYIDVVKLLLASGADVHAKGKRAIRDANRMGHHRIVEILEEAAVGKKRGRRKGVPGANVLSGYWGSAKVVIPGLEKE